MERGSHQNERFGAKKTRTRALKKSATFSKEGSGERQFPIYGFILRACRQVHPTENHGHPAKWNEGGSSPLGEKAPQKKSDVARGSEPKNTVARDRKVRYYSL